MKFSNINLAVQSAAPQSATVPPAGIPQFPPEAMGVPQAPAPVPAACQPQLVPTAPAQLPPEAMAVPPFPEIPLPPPPPFMDGGYGQVPPPAPAAGPAPKQSQAAPASCAPAPQQAPRTQAPAAKEDHYDDSWMPLELRKNRSLMGMSGKPPKRPAPVPAAQNAPAPAAYQQAAAAPRAQASPAPAAAAPIPQADSAAPASMSALAQMAREFEMAKDFLTELSKCQLCPKALKGAAPRDFFWVIQKGLSVGLSPTQALESITILNGKACMYGDALLALCMPHGDIQETFDEGQQMAVCTCRRPGKTPVTRTFSMKEAMDAGLLAFDKDGHALGKSREGWTRNVPWGSYPRRMLLMRARGFALRDAFPDVLKGIISAEEAMDYRV